MSMYGLPEEAIDKINEVLARYHQVDEAVLFGSRAKGSSRPGSDIDLTLKGNSLDLHFLNKISLDLDDLLLPYNIDLSIYHKIEDPDVLDHIKRLGKVIYKRKITEK